MTSHIRDNSFCSYSLIYFIVSSGLVIGSIIWASLATSDDRAFIAVLFTIARVVATVSLFQRNGVAHRIAVFTTLSLGVRIGHEALAVCLTLVDLLLSITANV